MSPNSRPAHLGAAATVPRARKMQRFLSQPFHVGEQFTGLKGKYVVLADTIRGFKEIVAGPPMTAEVESV